MYEGRGALERHLEVQVKRSCGKGGREERESFRLRGLASGVFHARMTEESLLSGS